MIKIGVIGGGPWGQNHIKTLHQMGCLAGVAELSETRRSELKSKYPDTEFYSSSKDLMKNCQGVVIATPAPTHFEVAKECIEKGLPVLIEKPMTLKSKEAEDIGLLAEKSGNLVMVGHLLLFQPAVQFIRKYLDDGKLGKLYSIHMNRLNLGRVRKVENVLWSLGVHDIAVGLYLVNRKPLGVHGWGHSILQKNIQDDFMVHMECENDVHINIHSSWIWPSLKREMTVIGSQGALHFDEVAQKVTLKKSIIDSSLEAKNQGEEILFEEKSEPLKLELMHFMDCIEKKTKCISDHKLGIRVIKVIEEAHE